MDSNCIQSAQMSTLMRIVSGNARNIHLGAIAQGVWGQKSSGEAPVRDPKTEAVCRQCLQILTAETSKNGKFCTFTS